MKAYSLSDQSVFGTFNGLWTGKKEPLVEAWVLRNTNFGPDGILDPSDVAKLQVEKRQLDKRRLACGDIILERSGGSAKQPVGRVVLFDLVSPQPFSFSNFTSAIRVLNPSLFEPRFVHYFLLDFYFEGGTKPLQSNTTGLRNLNFDSYLQIEVPCPPLDEQRKIAAVLGKVQAAVAVEGDLVRVARELKQAALRQLFTRGLRGESQKQAEIGYVPESWDVVRLEECCSVLNSSMAYTELLGRDDDVAADAVDCMGVKVSDMNLDRNERSFVIANLRKKIAVAEAKRRTIPSETIVFPKRGAAIATNKKRMTTTWTVLDPNLIGVRAGERLLPCFLFQWFQQFDLRTITEPGPTPQLNKKNLTPLLLPVPREVDEQREIAALLSTLDAKIAHHDARQTLLRELFRTLLHDLLTARRRVTSLDFHGGLDLEVPQS